VAFKNVTVSEDYFQGHFPGTPLMPAVLMIEALTQLAAALILDRAGMSGCAASMPPSSVAMCFRGIACTSR
jgi:3-hydroxymyristoyl/3-hydroxydecanoyl-(acyl carrier protein) dehydratase